MRLSKQLQSTSSHHIKNSKHEITPASVSINDFHRKIITLVLMTVILVITHLNMTAFNKVKTQDDSDQPI
ncbi:MAG: hypothetical protein PWP30_2408 [Eubacteriaceae bacterium]|jgi:hypothetical protein|nr:hypothetical protein [Eubacteriaceae bacterium]